MKIERIGRAEVRILSEAALRAVQTALEPYGVKVEIGRCQYSNGSTGKLAFELVGSGANPDKENFERCAGLIGLQASDYGRTVVLNGTPYRLVGIELGRPKFPLVGERAHDGKRFKLTDTSVRRALQAGV